MGVFTLPQLFVRSPLFPRRGVLAMVGLQTLCLYLTFSRGSMLGFVAGASAIAMLRYRKLLALMFVAGLLFVLLPFTQDYIQNLILGLTGQDRSTQMRFGEYRDALDLISRYPIFGVGFTGAQRSTSTWPWPLSTYSWPSRWGWWGFSPFCSSSCSFSMP